MKALVIVLSVINIIQGVTFVVLDIKYRIFRSIIRAISLYNDNLLETLRERMIGKGAKGRIKVVLFHAEVLIQNLSSYIFLLMTYALVLIDIISGGYYLFHIGMEYSNSQLTFLIVIAIMSFLFYGMLMAVHFSRKEKLQQIFK